MVYGMFSRVIDTFLEEQVGPTVEVSHPSPELPTSISAFV